MDQVWILSQLSHRRDTGISQVFLDFLKNLVMFIMILFSKVNYIVKLLVLSSLFQRVSHLKSLEINSKRTRADAIII